MQQTNLIYLGFRIPQPDHDLDASTDAEVLVIQSFMDCGQWLTEPARRLDHLCIRSTSRARAHVATFGCHSPTGFSWGYAGSGPAELAFMILLDLGLLDRVAWRVHQAFKSAFIARLPVGPWQLSESTIRGWLAENGVTRRPAARERIEAGGDLLGLPAAVGRWTVDLGDRVVSGERGCIDAGEPWPDPTKPYGGLPVTEPSS